MVRERLLPPKALRLVLLLLVLILVAAYAPAAAPAAGQAKVDRLVMGLILPYRDYWRSWLPVGSADHNIQHDRGGLGLPRLGRRRPGPYLAH
jgi:hypothetical protein